MPRSQLKQELRTDDGKSHSDHLVCQRSCYATAGIRQYLGRQRLDSRGNEEERPTMPPLSDSLHYSPYPLRNNRTPVVNYTRCGKRKLQATITTDTKSKKNDQTKVEKRQKVPCDTSSKKQLEDINIVQEGQPDVFLDPVVRDEIVRKTSICLSFYGNFVIIPAVRETLNKIKRIDCDAKLCYWHEVMAFIDSYDLPDAKDERKELVDELVAEITKCVEKKGIPTQDWRKIICTLPDDVTSKFDYRLGKDIFDEVQRSAKQKRLPFGLSGPISLLLESTEEYAGEYIRESTD